MPDTAPAGQPDPQTQQTDAALNALIEGHPELAGGRTDEPDGKSTTAYLNAYSPPNLTVDGQPAPAPE